MRLECSQLSYSYPGSLKQVIQDLSFSMEGPGFNAVFGPSGVGKTSLAKVIASLDGASYTAITNQGISAILYTYNQERLPGWSGVGRHLDRVTPEGRQELKQELVTIFGLDDLLESRFAELSMGQQNRINLIRYLLQDFDLLIMDESLANVDEKLRESILLSIKSLFGDRMFLYISHNLIEVATYCRDILVMGRQMSSAMNNCVVSGQDLCLGDTLDKVGVDRVMLEIMNAV